MTAVSVLGLPGFERARAHLAARLVGQARPEEAPRLWPPANIERTDPSWFARGLEGEITLPPPALHALPPGTGERAAAACGLASLPARTLPAPLCVACARWCWPHLVDLPAEASEPPTWSQGIEADEVSLATDVPRFPAALLSAAIGALGAVELGHLLRRVPDRAAAAVCGLLPAPLRSRVWTARRAAEGETPTREQVALLPGLLQNPEPGELIFAQGARLLGGFLRAASPVSLVQAAQLLPVPAARHLMTGEARSILPKLRLIAAFSAISTPA